MKNVAAGPHHPETPYIDISMEIAPGVDGYTVDLGDKGLYVPLLMAKRPGNGDVGRYLDSLPLDRRVVVPGVISGILEGMLERRGFSLIFGSSLREYIARRKRSIFSFS